MNKEDRADIRHMNDIINGHEADIRKDMSGAYHQRNIERMILYIEKMVLFIIKRICK